MSSESIKCPPATHLNVCIDRRKQAHGREAFTKADDQSYLSEFYIHFKIFLLTVTHVTRWVATWRQPKQR